MSDKKKDHHDSEIPSLLKKKSNRKKIKTPKLEKELDIKKIRDRFFNQMIPEAAR